MKDDSVRALQPVIGKEIFGQLQRHMGDVLVGKKTHFQMSVSRDGRLQYLDATLSPDFDANGKVAGFVFYSSDVTEKNRTERVLKDYFENASIGIHWVNADGIIIWANPGELKMLGYTEDEYIGHHISQFHASDKAIDDILCRLRNRESIENFEVDLRCKDGSVKHTTLNSTVLWEGDRFLHTRCFTVDITEQKRAISALKESEERFRMMANLVPLIICMTDVKGSCNFLSEKWVELTGTEVSAGLGDRWHAFIHPEDAVKIRNSWKASLEERKPFDAKFRMRKASGGYAVMYANLRPRFDEEEQFAGHIGILQDVSVGERIKSSLEKMVLERTEDLRKKNEELRRAEEALQKKNEKLEEINAQLSSFAHVASHDLQEPLRKIQTFVSRLFDIEGSKFSERGKELYERVYRSSERMKKLIQDLLAYSRTSGAEGVFQPVDLNSVLNDVLGELEVKISEKNGRIVSDELPRIEGIPFQLHQLFLNLVSNALKFSGREETPQVTIRSRVVDDGALPTSLSGACERYHHISVADNGIGFEPAAAERIFEIFHRLHNRAEYEGTGIGLAICKKIMENHSGGITAEGKANAGATFHLYFPAC